MNQMPDCETFIQYIGKNYEIIETKLKMLAFKNNQQYSQDAFQEVIIKCYEKIKQKGKLNDNSSYGIESYLIKSYFNFLIDEKRSARVKKRDLNYSSDNINELYENYYNSNNESARSKIASDLFKDFSTLYILNIVEQQFDEEHFYLFKLKYLGQMTYSQVFSKTKIKNSRQKILEVMNFLKENISKDEIKKAFNEIYEELL